MVIDPSQGYQLHPNVALRPEPFGALAYHYGNRRLVFLKTPKLVELVRSIGDHGSLDAAIAASGVTEAQRARYLTALDGLARSEMLVLASSVTEVEAHVG